MALFARKNKNANDAGSQSGDVQYDMPIAPNAPGSSSGAPSVTTSPSPSNGTFNGDAFSPDEEEALYQAAVGKGKTKKKRAVRTSRGLKGGSVVGLNIGNETIKAVELRGKGTDVAVTAIGSVATPPDCLSNGVILNPVSLASALRDLFAQSGIKSRNVITSVSGSGALVVRVLEVPRMSDADLVENINTDLERYIPFPPNEVVKDFRPLRELPSDPDAPNMEVLLAAAQNEVIDQHLQVLNDAKIQPQAIDVEPLAAARAVFYNTPQNGSDGLVDYSQATALVNIGATNTEISVLRGDILVFTRSVPVGGQALTQALADTLGMSWPDAEQLKIDMGDALAPSTQNDTHGANGASTSGEWNEFDQIGGANADYSQSDNFDDLMSTVNYGATPVNAVVTSTTTSATASATSVNSTTEPDPFSSDFFESGPNDEPTGNDPQTQHRQKQDDSGEGSGGKERLPSFDLSRFNFSEEERIVDEDIPTTPPDEPDTTVRPVSVADVAAAISTMSAGAPIQAESPDFVAPATTSSPRVVSSQAPISGDATLPAISNDPAISDVARVSASDEATNLPGVLDFPMAGEEDFSSVAPSGQMYGMNSPEDPDLISFPSLPYGLRAAGEENDLFEDEDALPTMTDEDDEDAPLFSANDELIELPSLAADQATTPTASGAIPPLSPTASFDAPSGGQSSATTSQSATPSSTAPTTPVESVFDFSDVAPAENKVDDFESAFADMIGDTTTSTAKATATPATAPTVTPPAFAMNPSIAPEQSDFDLDQYATPTGADNFGIDDFGFGMGASDSGALTPAKVHEVLQPRLAELVAEIRRSLEYFSSRYPDASVQRIVLVGGGARLPNIDALLTQEIGIPSVVDRPLSRVPLRVANLPNTFVDEQGATFAVATGLALRDLVS